MNRSTDRTRRATATRLLAVPAAGLLLAALPAGAALADPQPTPAQATTLSCDGQTYDVVLTESNGQWTPAFDTASNRVFKPIGFLEAHYSITVLDGPMAGYTESGTDDTAAVKGGLRKGQDVVECSFESSFSGFDDYAGGNVEGSWGGTVLGVVHG